MEFAALTARDTAFLREQRTVEFFAIIVTVTGEGTLDDRPLLHWRGEYARVGER